IIDEARHKLALTFERDRNREHRDAVKEVRGAVQRVDDPAVRLVGTFDLATLFHEVAIARPPLGEFLKENLFGLAVRGRHEYCRAFQRNRKLFDFSDIALAAARSLSGTVLQPVYRMSSSVPRSP